MDDYKLIYFLSMGLMSFPQLIVCAVGFVLGMTRRDLGKRATFGVIGFGLWLGAMALACFINYLTAYKMTDANERMELAKFVGIVGFATMGLQVAGFIFLVLAAFHRDRPKPVAV